MKLRLILLSLCFLLNAQTCNKEIILPNPELKKLFGRWEWIESSGGFAGKIITPVKSGYTEEIVFAKDGTWRKYKNGNLSDYKKFSIAEGKSVVQSESDFIISFTNVDSLFMKSIMKQSIRFEGNDTLHLNEECHDCFQTVFVRKK